MDKSLAYELIKKPLAAGELTLAVKAKAKHMLHVHGTKFIEYLERHEGIQSENAFKLKKKLSRAETPRIFEAVMSFSDKIFKSHGGSFQLNYNSENQDAKAEALDYVNTSFGRNMGVEEFMQRVWKQLLFEDCTALLMVTLPPTAQEGEKPAPYVTYVPIEVIHDLGMNGDKVGYVIIKGRAKVAGQEVDTFRVVDPVEDIIYYVDGSELKELSEGDGGGTLINPWGEVPAVQISNQFFSGQSKVERRSPITKVLGTADKYLDIESDHTICVKLHQHPLFVSLPVTCPDCNGEKIVRGFDIDKNPYEKMCTLCNGNGSVPHYKRDVSQGITVPLPAPNPDGSFPAFSVGDPAKYVEPDIESIVEQRVELYELEKAIEKGTLGTEGLLVLNPKEETATGKQIDIDPAYTMLSRLSENKDVVQQKLVDWVLRLRDGKIYKNCTVHTGTNFGLRNFEDIYNDLDRAKKTGATQTMLFELQQELIIARFKNNPRELERALLLLELEPLPVYTMGELASMPYLRVEDIRFKAYFNDVVEDFERKHGSVLYYKENMEFEARVKALEDELLTIYKTNYGEAQRDGALTEDRPDNGQSGRQADN